MGEDYDSLSGKLSSNITLTAQTIVDVTDIFPVLTAAVTDTNKENEVKTKLSGKGDDVKVALIAEVENKLTISKNTVTVKTHTGANYVDVKNISSYSITTDLEKVSLSGDFDIYTDYLSSLSSKIDISNVNIVSKRTLGEENVFEVPINELKTIYEKLNLKNIDKNKLPRLNFKIYDDTKAINNSSYYGLKHFLDIYDKYNSSEKMQITGSFNNNEIDGSKFISNSSGYTLFSNNTAKTSADSSIKSIKADELVNLSNKYGIKTIKNIIVSGVAAANSVNWTNLTNVIFEGDMSKLNINLSDNTSNLNLTGVVYFKSLPYTHSKESLVEGAVKLDTFPSGFKLNKNSVNNFVLDLTNVNSYTGSPIGGSINAVYFKDNPDNKGTETLFEKIVSKETGVIFNVYYGNSRSSDSYNKNKATGNNEYYESSASKRSLKDFEDYGNNKTYPDGTTRA